MILLILFVTMLCVDWSGYSHWQTNSTQTVGRVRITLTISAADLPRYIVRFLHLHVNTSLCTYFVVENVTCYLVTMWLLHC